MSNATEIIADGRSKNLTKVRKIELTYDEMNKVQQTEYRLTKITEHVTKFLDSFKQAYAKLHYNLDIFSKDKTNKELKVLKNRFNSEYKDVKEYLFVVATQFNRDNGFPILRKPDSYYSFKINIGEMSILLSNTYGKVPTESLINTMESFLGKVTKVEEDEVSGAKKATFTITEKVTSGNNREVSNSAIIVAEINMAGTDYQSPDERGYRAPIILDGTNGVVPVAIKFTAYQSMSKEDLNTITSGLCDTNRAFATKVMNTALKSNGKVTIPLLEASLFSVPTERSKAIVKEEIFKLPNSEYFKCKFIDRREELKQDVRDTIGQSVIPEKLSKYLAPARGIIYDSYGNKPDYIPDNLRPEDEVKYKLEPEDYFYYCYRRATPNEINNGIYDKKIAISEDVTIYNKDSSGNNLYLIRVEPTKSDLIEKWGGKIIYTDFENEFIFYYISDGSLRKKPIHGFQKLSNYDILYLTNRAPIDFKPLIAPTTREDENGNQPNTERQEKILKWTESADFARINELVKQIRYNAKEILSTPQKGEKRDEDYGGTRAEQEALDAKKNRILNDQELLYSYKIMPYMMKAIGAYDEMMNIYDRFASIFHKEAAVVSGSIGAVCRGINDPSKSGYDLNKILKDTEVKEEHFLQIAEDKDGNTPYLPKNIKNFTTKMSLFPQQSIAVSTANDQDIAMIDVDMGGGKTCMMVADILNQMTKGKVKRPLIVCPGKTLAQNKKEIEEKWCDNRINIFAINTETWNRYTAQGSNTKEFTKMILGMPPNTIFMTDYSWVANDREEIVTGTVFRKGVPVPVKTNIYHHANYLMREIGFDMIYLDESHYIKNPKSTYSEAVSILGKAPIKRITSGTIIPNNPKDLFGQLRFLDPTILGKEDDFLRQYGKFEQPVDDDGNPKTDKFGNVKPPILIGWAEGSQKRLRRLIQERGGVSIRRSMWRWRMPALEEHLHRVRLTPIQTILYDMIMQNIKQIIGGNKLLQEAAQKLKDDEYDQRVDDNDAGDSVLSKLSRFTTFLSVPESDIYIKALRAIKEGKSTAEVVKEFNGYSLEDEDDVDSNIKKKGAKGVDDKVSLSAEEVEKLRGIKIENEDIIGPKIAKVNELISNHCSHGFDKDGSPSNGKVIVFCQRNDVARNTYNNLDPKLKSHAVWYNASREAELVKFQKDPNIWIIIAVDKALKEGINLQMASRIIRMDLNWNPGDNDQSYARAFRNGQKRKVDIDIILCDGTMEVCKYMRLVSKEFINRKLTSDYQGPSNSEFPTVKMSLDDMEQFSDFELAEKYQKIHNDIQEDELRESAIYAVKYSSYESKNISKVGSTENLEGSEDVFVPELAQDRRYLNEEGQVRKYRLSVPVYLIGKPKKDAEKITEELFGSDEDNMEERKSQQYISKYGFDPNDIIEKQTNDTSNMHWYLWDEAGTLMLLCFSRKAKVMLGKAGLNMRKRKNMQVKQVRTVDEVKTLYSKLKKSSLDSNLMDIVKDQGFSRCLKIHNEPNATIEIKKISRATAAKYDDYLQFGYARMEGGTFLTYRDDEYQLDKFSELPEFYYCEIKSLPLLGKFLSKINAVSPIGNLEDINTSVEKMFGRKLRLFDVIKNSLGTKKVSEEFEDDEDEDRPIVTKKPPIAIKKVNKPIMKPLNKHSVSIKPSKPTFKPTVKPSKIEPIKKAKVKLSECSPSSVMIGFIDWALHNGKQAMIDVANGFENLTGYRCKDIAKKFSELPSVISKNKKLIKSLDRVSKANLAKLGKEIGIGNEVADYVAKYM